MTMDQGQEMTLTLSNYIPSMISLVLHLANFKSQAAMVSKISIVFAFSHVKAYASKIDLAAE